MQRHGSDANREGRRKDAERDAAQPIAGQPRGDDEELQEPERVPSLLTARELEARKPRPGDGPADEAAEGERPESKKKKG